MSKLQRLDGRKVERKKELLDFQRLSLPPFNEGGVGEWCVTKLSGS